jgi:hypothetical protein
LTQRRHEGKKKCKPLHARFLPPAIGNRLLKVGQRGELVALEGLVYGFPGFSSLSSGLLRLLPPVHGSPLARDSAFKYRFGQKDDGRGGLACK